MSKLEQVIEKAQDVTIVTKKLTQRELDEFVAHVSSLSTPRENEVSFTSYVKEKFYKDTDYVVVPDITGLELNSKDKEIDLKGVDFTGSIINGVKFINCNLTNAVFCDCDMNNVYFDKSKLVNTDFRGAILIGATLGPSYDFIGQRKAELELRGLEYIAEEHIDFLPREKRHSYDAYEYEEQRNKKYETQEARFRNDQREREAESAREKQVQAREAALIAGAKFDTTVSLAYTYKREHSDERSKQKVQAKEEFEKAVAAKEKELAAKRQLIQDKIDKFGVIGGFASWALGGEATELYEERDKHDEEAPKNLEAFKKKASKELAEKYLAYREDSFVRVFYNSSQYDPCYRRGSSAEERNKEHIYIPTSVENVKAYLLKIKEPGQEQLTLNEFMRDEYNKEQLEKLQEYNKLINHEFVGKEPTPYDPLPDDVVVHADCSSNSYGAKKDFSGMVFEKAHLKGVVFAGSKLNNTVFRDTDISHSSFESCKMSGTTFTKVTARGAKFFRADLQDTNISENSDFTNTILTKANATGAKIAQTNLSKAQGQYVILDKAGISDSILDGADLKGASLISATIERTSMIQIRLDNAVLEYCKVTECDLRKASLENVKAQYAEFQNVQLQAIQAQNANFVDAHFDALCNLEGADLQQAVMERVKLNGVSLVGAQMQFANLRNAEMEKAIVEGAQMQFADLTGAVANGLKASGVNLTGAALKQLEAQGADFRKAVLQDVEAQGADFQKAIMEEANLLGAKFTDAILKEVELRKAKVNLHTDFSGADIEGVKGADELIQQVIQDDGTVVENQIQLKEQIRKAELVKDAQSRGFARKALGNLIQGTGSMIEGVGEFVKQPFSDKIGLKAGAIVGSVIALCVVASVAAPLIPGAWLATPFVTTTIAVANLIPGVGILTSSIALAAIPVKMLAVTISSAAPTFFTAVGINVSVTAIPIIATSAAAVVTTVASVAGGAFAGRYVVQHIKLSHVAAATAGFTAGLAYGVVLGPLAPLVGIGGAIAGIASTVAVNSTSKKLTGGSTIDDLVSSGVGWLGGFTKSFGGRVGIIPEQADLFKEHAKYKPVNSEQHAQELAAAQAAEQAKQKEQIVVVKITDLPLNILASVQTALPQSTSTVSMQASMPLPSALPSTEINSAKQLQSSTAVLSDQSSPSSMDPSSSAKSSNKQSQEPDTVHSTVPTSLSPISGSVQELSPSTTPIKSTVKVDSTPLKVDTQKASLEKPKTKRNRKAKVIKPEETSQSAAQQHDVVHTNQASGKASGQETTGSSLSTSPGSSKKFTNTIVPRPKPKDIVSGGKKKKVAGEAAEPKKIKKKKSHASKVKSQKENPLEQPPKEQTAKVGSLDERQKVAAEQAAIK